MIAAAKNGLEFAAPSFHCQSLPSSGAGQPSEVPSEFSRHCRYRLAQLIDAWTWPWRKAAQPTVKMTGKIWRNCPRSSSCSDTRPFFSFSSKATSRFVCVAEFLATWSYVRISLATRAARRTSSYSTSGMYFENSLTSFWSSLSLRCTDHTVHEQAERAVGK